MTRQPVAHFVRDDGSRRPIFSWEMAIAISQRDELRDRLLIDFDAWLHAGMGFDA